MCVTDGKYIFFRILSLAIILFALPNLSAKEYSNYSQTTYGGIGLIETPTARFSDDGEFLFGLSTDAPYNRLYAKVQFFPWLESVLRYTEGTYINYHGSCSSPSKCSNRQTWKDKGIDLKFRILEEKRLTPEIALGLYDLGGTGAYSSEFIVATKNYNNFDFTFGLGWGRLAGVDHIQNPVTWIDDGRKTRGGFKRGYGGTINPSNFFSGERVSFFGGAEYFTNVPNLSVKLEYNTSDYSRVSGKKIVFTDENSDIFELDSRINFALNYVFKTSPRDEIDLSLGFVRGNTIYANFAISSNLNQPAVKKFTAPPETLNKPYLKEFSKLNDNYKKYLTDLIIWQMGNVGFVTHRVIFNENEMLAEISQGRFQNTAQAFDLASRILANNSPKNIDQITVVNIDQGIETLRSTIQRKELVKGVSKGPLDESLLTFTDHNYKLTKKAIIRENEILYPNFYWEIKPHMTGTLQHQRKFYFWQLEALIHAEYSFKRGLYLMADIGINIDNNFETYTYHVPDGELYHVRQDRRLYLTEGESGIRRLAIDYLVDISPNIKGKISAGYLEWMYGGFGGEVMYMPDNKNWAIGFDAYWVKQREFDQKFSFKDYETITGFLSYYYDLPFYDMRMKVSAGKFLGKDVGMHLDLSRRFESGARVGGIVALTDCDSVCVGEGSFNKWIYFELPMDLFYNNASTRAKAGYAWSPLTKDAGQKVEPGNLYGLMVNAKDEVKSLKKKQWSFKKIMSGFGTKPKHTQKTTF